jgi:hypothetical protein
MIKHLLPLSASGGHNLINNLHSSLAEVAANFHRKRSELMPWAVVLSGAPALCVCRTAAQRHRAAAACTTPDPSCHVIDVYENRARARADACVYVPAALEPVA